jgi:1,4-dihydroxy-2-naphthoate octaprenyltransferase
MPQTKVVIWLEAARLRTLPAAAAPVLIGSVMAAVAEAFSWLAAILAFAAAMLIQIGTNLHNDYADYNRGADNANRVGPRRAAQAGLLTPVQLQRGAGIVFVAAAAVGVIAASSGGWPILIVLAVSVSAAVAYTGGRKPLGYLGLGDPMSFIFFGPVATSTTYYLHTGNVSIESIIAGIGPGLMATAILIVNNLRDIETDRISGKRTLAVRWGASFARAEYVACVVLAAAAPAILGLATGRWTTALPLMTIVAASPWLLTVLRPSGPAELNHALSGTARTMLLHALLFCIGWSIA